jgi:hypothetical protein
MTFQFQLTADDYASAQLTHFRKAMAPSKWRLVLNLVSLGVILIFGAFVGLFALLGHDWQLIKDVAPSGYVFLFFLLLTLYVWSGIPYRRQFRKLKALQRPMEIVVGDDAVSYTSAVGESKLRWEGFEAWRESKKIFLLYPQANIFVMLPKRVMQPDQIPAFREILKDRIRNT